MAAQALPLANPAHAAAYRSLCDWLMADPSLRTVVRLWRAWQGSVTDAVEPVGPAELPWVRLTPMAEAMEPFAVLGGGLRSFSAPLAVTIEAAVANSLAEDSMKLAWALFDRVDAWDFSAVAVSWIVPRRPAEGINDGDYTIATGSVLLQMYSTF